MKNFALIGLAGYIAPRHLAAIRDTGNKLIAAVDPRDSVGVIDQYFPDAHFFTEIERFDRHLEKLRRRGDAERVHYISICSPNFLHDAHCRMALRVDADAICEKPLVLKPWNLDPLLELERETNHRVYNILQLRHHAPILKLKAAVDAQKQGKMADVVLTYVTRRGRWYDVSWKGDDQKSGGVIMNIGIHFFDMLLWIFGRVQRSDVHVRTPSKAAGVLELERARVRWFLSTDSGDLPPGYSRTGKPAFRSITVDGEEIDFSGNFTELHTTVYREILAGRGYGIEAARPSIELVSSIRNAEIAQARESHPMIGRDSTRPPKM